MQMEKKLRKRSRQKKANINYFSLKYMRKKK